MVAWTLLTAVICYELKCAAEDARLGSGCGKCPTCYLKMGLIGFALLHLIVGAARLILETPQVYPAAMVCLPASAASVLVYAFAAATSLRDHALCVRKRAKNKSDNTTRLESDKCISGENI